MVQEEQRQDGGPAKRIYAITPAGQQVLYDWLLTPIPARHQRDEVFLKLMLSLATGAVDPMRVIYAQRASRYQDLHDVTAQRTKANPQSELAYILLLDHAIMHLEANLCWLDMVEARLDDVRRQPIPEPVSHPRGRPKKEKEVLL